MMKTKNPITKVILAQPRGFCAGVNRAIEIVDIALDMYEPPIYVRHEIVHNHHVVQDFKDRGVVFIESLDEVPDNSKLIFSAHGTSPEVIEKAKARGLEFIDAVCPLVTKVHMEIKAAIKKDFKVIYIGHRGHQEVLGAIGYAQNQKDDGTKAAYSEQFNPDQDIFLVETVEEVEKLKAAIGDTEAIVATQTTLSLNDTAKVIEALKDSFPKLHLPKSEDICYATTNRQDAVKELAKETDYILIIGSENSSNTLRLLELAATLGVEAQLVPDPDEFDLNPLRDFACKQTKNLRVGISSGASAPEFLVDSLIARLLDDPDFQYAKGSDAKHEDKIEVLKFKEEKVTFPLPKELV